MCIRDRINIIGNKEVECVEEGKDQYKRILAECFVNNISLSSYLVKEGYAFAYRKYSKKFVLVALIHLKLNKFVIRIKR